MAETRTIEGTEVSFNNPGGRWVFAGCRTTGGYETIQDAMVEARLQLTNLYSGSLNTAEVDPKDHRASVKTLKVLWARW